MSEARYTGIIRTMPFRGHTVAERRASLRALLELFHGLQRGDYDSIYTSMPQKPKHDVLHCYTLIGGRIRWQTNIAGFEDGSPRECVDGQVWHPKYWMILTAPFVRPPFIIKMKGFQGFRYTEDLW